MRRITKLSMAFFLVLTILCMTQVSLADCDHPNVNHSYTIYYNQGSSGHSSQTICKCLSCGATLGCHPHPGPTPTTPHVWTPQRTTYTSNGGSGHTVTTYNRCVCGATSQTTSTASHNFVQVGDAHGSGNVHYVYYKCVCGQTMTRSYYSTGDPCSIREAMLIGYSFD